jgi:8-oxo-dGTP pyrophosphatase MutT (NUDIX family)
MSEKAPAAIAKHVLHDGMEFLRTRLYPEQPEVPLVPKRSDYDLNPRTRPQERRELAPAAVLLPIVLRNEPSVLFTQRTSHLPRHAGQVSFPGGRAQSSDLTLVETALRETQEETGIVPAFVSVAGFLDPYETGTGYAILPVVGLLSEGFALAPDSNEVADVFEVPLAFLLDANNRERHSREWQGRTREFYAFTHDGRYIWGATAAILVNFAERLGA